MLTTGVDNLTGTAGNDTFTADNTGATAVLSSADVLNGGAGTDTLNIFSAGTAFNLPALTSIETVNIYDQDADQSIASANFASVTTANLIRGDGEVALTVGSNVATVGVSDVIVATGANGVVINAAAAATALALNLNGVTRAGAVGDEDVEVNGAALTSLTVNATGTASSFAKVDADAATTVTVNADVALTAAVVTTGADATLNISGAGKVTLGQLGNDFDVVNASGNTGGVVLTVAAANADAVITLGSGADTVTTDDDGFATADKFAVNAGDGEDTLVIAADADVDTAGEAGRYTNFEVIQRNINADLDMSVFGASTTITKASLGNGGLTKMQAALAQNITLTADNGGSTFSLATDTGTADVLTITSKNATATASADLTTVSIDGFETLNFAADSGDATLAATADRTAISFTTADQVKTINLTGSKSVNLDASANIAALTAINASGITGGAIIATGGQTGALTVTGSEVVDQITIGAVGGAGTVTVNAGAGKDTIIGTVAIVTAATINGGADEDTVSFTNTNATTETLTVEDNTFAKMTSVEVIDFGGAIAGDLLWNIGGFANALATANGGVLKVTGDTFATGAAADDITINASSMSAGNSINVNIKNTDATAGDASDIAVTGSDGNDTVMIEEATAASANIITVTAGAGNDTVTVKTTATHDGAIVINVGAGNDTVDVSGATSDAAVTANLITVAGGNNTIKLDTEGADTDFTIVLGATAATTGVNTITNFTQGTGGDVLKIDAFLDATAFNGALTVNPGATTDATSDVNLLVDIAGGQDITTAAGLTAALAAGGEYANVDMTASGKAVFVTAASNAAGQTQYVFYGTSDAGGNISVELVGTIANADIDSFVGANFAI